MKKFMAVLAVVALVAFAAPAFAANPFADVPAGHWAYDAVAQLAADGLISGYPDGAFKGAQQATRYEVAAMVARAVAAGDAKHASKKDVELLKKLCV
ncbi:MAG: S-layer homology domain-containing protein, partial [Synergistaceae bacterium]|nr:S-layer homology domain-containing protein [Candidatus Equadaptatus faecalis]